MDSGVAPAGDLDAVARAAHRLKGSAGNVSFTAMAEASMQLEDNSNAEDREGTRDAVAKLLAEVSRAEDAATPYSLTPGEPKPC